AIGGERAPRGFRQAFVRIGDAAPEGQVADHGPDDEEEDDQNDRDPDLAAPADPARAAGGRLRARTAVPAAPVALGALRALRPLDRRNPPLDAAAAVEAIRL